jgi:8-oxo-dGTP diphosphatase
VAVGGHCGGRLRRVSGAEAIRIAAAVIVGVDGRTLLVRKRGTEAFMQAGGKLGRGESPVDALRREISEELGCDVEAQPLALGCFRASAANEAGRVVEAELFAVRLIGEIRPAAEIEDAVWHDPDDLHSRILAPLSRDHALPIARSLRRRL